MHINLPYGSESVPIDVPDNWINGRCYRPHSLNECQDPPSEVLGAIGALSGEHSIAALTKGKNTCAIAVETDASDIFSKGVLRTVIEMIEDDSDIDKANITIILTPPMWEVSAPKEIINNVEPSIRESCNVIVHDPLDASQLINVGESSSLKFPITVNKSFVEADFKVVLGGVRPDIALGFTGGRSIVLPGLSGIDTLKAIYDFNNIANRKTRYGGFTDNPFHMTGIEASNAVSVDLSVSAILTPEGHIESIFAGHFAQSHFKAMQYLAEKMETKVKEPMDIVVTSGGGAPFDNTLAQVVSALSTCTHVLRQEGTIVIAAALEEGIGPKPFHDLVYTNHTVKRKMEKLSHSREFTPGQWIAQRFFSILQDHEVILYNKDLNEDSIWTTGMTPSRDMNEAILGAMESHGQRCKIVALPDGPRCLAEVAK